MDFFVFLEQAKIKSNIEWNDFVKKYPVLNETEYDIIDKQFVVGVLSHYKMFKPFKNGLRAIVDDYEFTINFVSNQIWNASIEGYHIHQKTKNFKLLENKLKSLPHIIISGFKKRSFKDILPVV